MAFLKGRLSTFWDALKSVLAADSGLQAAGVHIHTLDDGEAEAPLNKQFPAAQAELPYLRVTILSIGMERKYQSAHMCAMRLKFELFTWGFAQGDVLDFGEAVIRAFFPQQQPQGGQVAATLGTPGVEPGAFSALAQSGLVTIGQTPHGMRAEMVLNVNVLIAT